MLDNSEKPARVEGARLGGAHRMKFGIIQIGGLKDMGTATEQVKGNGKTKITVESFKTFAEALEALSEIGGVKTDKQEKVMVSNVLGSDGKSRVRGYEQSPIVLTDDGHVQVWVESLSMTPDKTEDQQFRFFLKREAVDLEGARLLATGSKLIEHFNYGYDLDTRQRVKPSLLADAKALGLMNEELPLNEQIDKQVRQTAKAAMLSEEDARTIVIASRKRQGLPVPEGE